jgi:hypothetical protein
MKTKDFKLFENEQIDLQDAATKFVAKELGLSDRNNKIEAYANEHKINYMDFAGAVIAEIKRQFNA